MNRFDRAARVLQMLGDENREPQERLAKKNSCVKTAHSRLGGEIFANLLCHGQVSATANLHVILGLPLLTVPAYDRFRQMAANVQANGR